MENSLLRLTLVFILTSQEATSENGIVSGYAQINSFAPQSNHSQRRLSPPSLEQDLIAATYLDYRRYPNSLETGPLLFDG